MAPGGLEQNTRKWFVRNGVFCPTRGGHLCCGACCRPAHRVSPSHAQAPGPHRSIDSAPRPARALLLRCSPCRACAGPRSSTILPPGGQGGGMWQCWRPISRAARRSWWVLVSRRGRDPREGWHERRLPIPASPQAEQVQGVLKTCLVGAAAAALALGPMVAPEPVRPAGMRATCAAARLPAPWLSCSLFAPAGFLRLHPPFFQTSTAG